MQENHQGWLLPAALDQTGHLDEAFGWADEIFQDWRGPGLNLCWYVANPFLDPLRADPRWQGKMLARVGLPEWPG